MKSRIKDFIAKLFGRKSVAFIIATIALFTGKIDGWMWISGAIMFMGSISFEKASEKIQEKIINRAG